MTGTTEAAYAVCGEKRAALRLPGRGAQKPYNREARRRKWERWFAHHRLALWLCCYLGVPAAVLGTVCLVCGLIALPMLLAL